MEKKGILVLSDELSEARSLASELAEEGYQTWALSCALAVSSRPRHPIGLLIVAFSVRREAALPLAELAHQWTGVPMLVSSAVGLCALAAPLRVLPVVSAVLFRPFGRETLLGAVADALGDGAREMAASVASNPFGEGRPRHKAGGTTNLMKIFISRFDTMVQSSEGPI